MATGALAAITAAIDNHPDTVSVQSAGMYALWAFSWGQLPGSETIENLAAAGVIGRAQIASTFPERSGPRRWSCLLLDKMAVCRTGVFRPSGPALVVREIAAACTATGFEADAPPRGIVVAMRQNRGNIQLLAHGCAALAELALPVRPTEAEVANYSRMQRVAKAGGIQAVVSALKNHLSHLRVQPPGVGSDASVELSKSLVSEALSAMAAFLQHEEAHQITIVSLAGLEAAVEAIRVHANARIVTLKGLCMLARLSQSYMHSVPSHVTHRQMAVHNASGIDLAVRLMRTFDTDPEVVHESCKLLGDPIFRNHSLRTVSVEAGSIEVAVSILQSSTFARRPDSIEQACKLITRLIYKPVCPEHRRAGNDNALACFLAGAPTGLIAALDTTNGVRLQMFLINALRDILSAGVDHGKSCRQFMKEGIRVLLAVMGQHACQVPFLRVNCVETLEVLLANEKAELAEVANAVKPLIRDDPFDNKKRYTKMCEFFLRGYCQNGNQCNFAHHESQLRWSEPKLTTKLCHNMIQFGSCEYGDECRLSHDMNAASETPEALIICPHWLRDRCYHGPTCVHLHGASTEPTEELYEREDNDGDVAVDIKAVQSMIAQRTAMTGLAGSYQGKTRVIIKFKELAAMGVILNDTKHTWSAGAPFVFEFAEWHCIDCGNMNNYYWRIECFRCRVTKPRGELETATNSEPASTSTDDIGGWGPRVFSTRDWPLQ